MHVNNKNNERNQRNEKKNSVKINAITLMNGNVETFRVSDFVEIEKLKTKEKNRRELK